MVGILLTVLICVITVIACIIINYVDQTHPRDEDSDWMSELVCLLVWIVIIIMLHHTIGHICVLSELSTGINPYE